MRGVPLPPSMLARTLVCVDGVDNFDLFGRLYNPYMEEPVRFRSVYDIFRILDGFFDRHSFPHAYFEYRTFVSKRKPVTKKNMGCEVQKYMSDEIFETEQGKKATFIVQVQFRQNASWQGEITWADEKKTQRFRSVLEMIKLMNEAVENGEPPCTWE